MSILSGPYFHYKAAAVTELERVLWPDGSVCPRCCGKEHITSVRGRRKGLWHCRPCKRQFTVTVGTLFESSHVPLYLWLQAIYLLCCSNKGISSLQLKRVLGVQYNTSWFMTHRIRVAMKAVALPPIGAKEAVVEIDETFTGRKPGHKQKRGYPHKSAVLTLVQRGGSARSFHVEGARAADLLPII
jgi:transposase-like protein